MSLLDSIIQTPQPTPPRILLYGTHGIGKSTMGAQTNKPIFIQTEDGLGEIDAPRFPLAKTLDDVMDAVAALYTEEHEYQTVVIDSADWLERLIWAVVCDGASVDNIDDIGYAKGYRYALGHWDAFLSGMDALREKRGMAAVILAHSAVVKCENPETETYDQHAPRLHKLASGLVQEWADAVLFASYKVHTRSGNPKDKNAKTRAIGTGERVLRTEERPSHLAKNRYNLPPELPLDWPTIQAAIIAGQQARTAPKTEAKTKAKTKTEGAK